MNRRRLVTGLLAGVSMTSTAGCFADESTPSPTSTPTDHPAASDVLPEARNGWTLRRTQGIAVRLRGGDDGVIGYYTSPDGTRFRAVLMHMLPDYSAEAEAEGWVCIGWDVGVAYRGFAFGAGTGTTQRTLTPEKPPHMTRTPIPDTEERSRELLSYSPLLSEEIIAENEVECTR